MLNPGKTLFGLNSSGNIFYLENKDSIWRPFLYMGLEFKRISAAKNVIWAVGGDHQIYVFVYGVELPIVKRECFYENERWNPIEGFCAKLLPTDRPNFSDVTGTIEKSKETIHPPSMAWVWYDEWHIDTLFNGVQLPIGGWTYAVDFPAEYYEKKGFTSCVRRRKWIRHRKFMALNSWSAIPSIHKDQTEEPFIDISAGGYDIAGGIENELMVWSVTITGRLMVRQGVTDDNPEGSGWIHIPTETGKEVSQVSVAASGLVWAVTWHGSVLIRRGVSALNPTGVSWCEIGAPRPDTPLSMVSIGASIVWCVGRDGSVWFRQGFKSSDTTNSDTLIKGTKWIKMVGTACSLSVGPADQVFIVCPAMDDRNVDTKQIQMRTGVQLSDISGKSWRTVSARAPFQSSLNLRCRSISESSRKTRHSSDSSSFTGSTSCERTDTISSSSDQTAVDVNVDVPQSSLSDESKGAQCTKENCHGHGESLAAKIAAKAGEMALSRTIGVAAGATIGRIPVAGPIMAQATTRVVSEEIKKLAVSDANSDSAGASGVQNNEKQDGKDSQIDESMYEDNNSLGNLSDRQDRYSISDNGSHTGRFFYDDDGELIGPGEPQWLWISAGSCNISPYEMPATWYDHTSKISRQKTMEKEPWRQNILANLVNNNFHAKSYVTYEDAIERSSWSKKAIVTFNLGEGGRKFEQAQLELEQCGSAENSVDFGTLSIFSTKSSLKEHVSLSDITCVSICTKKLVPQLYIFTSKRSKLLRPIQIKFQSESELWDWHSDLVTGINSVRSIQLRPSARSVFSVTNHGQVFVFDPQAAAQAGDDENSVVGHSFSQEIPVHENTIPLIESLANGFEPGSSLYLELRMPDNGDAFSVNLQMGKQGANSSGRDISLHFNPRLSRNLVVLNSHENGTWGSEDLQPLIVMLEDGSAVRAFTKNKLIQLDIKALESKYEVFVDGAKFASFKYRIRPENVTNFRVDGDVQIKKIVYSSNSRIIPPSDIYWRSIGGGHLLQVESGPSGVVWGLTYDGGAWCYTGGWGGGHFKNSSTEINDMTDKKYFYIYENQRWNPLTGFSNHGLPTDRYMWSDKTGKYSATKESVKLPSSAWHWTGEWTIDYHTPGGVDKEGWQYATDFPASYHGVKTFTDYVRRRRWARRCRLATSGPWKSVGTTKLVDISVQPMDARNDGSSDKSVHVWAVATNGEALLRQGVTRDNSEGTAWTHIRSDALFQSVSMGTDWKVWFISSEGGLFLRQGVSATSPSGHVWIQIQNPDKTTIMRTVTAGRSGVWCLDSTAKLWLRQGITTTFPEGTSWLHVADNVKNVSSGDREDLWAVLDNYKGVGGVIVRRRGISPSNPGGEDWEICIGGGWKQVSTRGWSK